MQSWGLKALGLLDARERGWGHMPWKYGEDCSRSLQQLKWWHLKSTDRPKSGACGTRHGSSALWKVGLMHEATESDAWGTWALR